MENVKRAISNFYSIPSWNATLTSEESDYLFLNYDTLVFCNGRARRIKVDKLTNNVFKFYTVKA